MAIKTILLLGSPKLCETAQEIKKEELPSIRNTVADLHDTMFDFRKKHGWGRGIAAPQIGVMKRLIYIHVDKPLAIINPVMTFKSEEHMELWDDCMSFPELLVKVKRHVSCSIKYRDLDWNEKELFMEKDMSELFQHEYDHLDGILAVSRAIDGKSYALASEKKEYVEYRASKLMDSMD